MNSKALQILEYNKITDMLTQHADSEPAKRMCADLKPSGKIEWIRKSLEETEAAVNRIFKSGSVSFGSNRDLGYALKSLAIGHALSASELLGICSFLENVSKVKKYGEGEGQQTPEEERKTDILDKLFEELTPLPQITRRISEVIISEDEIADTASPELASIRRQIRICNDRIHSHLNGMLNGSARSYLQDPVITMRGDRYCLPVRSEYKSQVPGIVHDQSSTGATFFIEPSAVVELGNQIKTHLIEEQREIERILAELSLEVGEHAEDIQVNCKHMTRLDFIFARAKLALDMNAVKPGINESGIIRLYKARHPLLDRKTVVPTDISVGDEYTMLIITGPNTGGKTVSLKTVGLLTLMAQSGMFIPASDRSEIAAFREVYADIGDEQSIEQSLSTFSSHMTNIVSILKGVDERSLCLFDELGAGTDPEEGAALAIAILDSLHQRGIRALATTHYSELKAYALTTPGVENASCEFDVEKLAPTYRLLTGIPGRSNAFAIAKRLGLEDGLIRRARENMAEDTQRFEDLVADLDRRRKLSEDRELAITENETRITDRTRELDARQARLEEKEEHILDEAREQARLILQEAKDEADRTIRYFQSVGGSVSMSELEKARTAIREKISDTSKDTKRKEAPVAPGKKLDPSKLKTGESVRIISSGLKGVITGLADSSGKLEVQCGIIKSRVPAEDIEIIDEEQMVKKGRLKPARTGISKTQNISTEINLLGMTTDEAIYRLDKYIDDALLAGLSTIRIVHGKGTGALRDAVASHLRRSKSIASFRLGEYGEGDAGVTIAELK